MLATKVHGTMGDDPNQFGNSRRWIMREVEDSLRRLQTDWIDLYQIHRPEPDTDIDETLGALTDLVRAGKVRYFGSSTFPAVADRRGAVGRRAARPRALRLRAAAVLDAGPRHRGRRAADLPALRHGRDPVEPARRRLAVRRATARAPSVPTVAALERCSRSATTCRLPANQRKLDAADAARGSSPTRPGITLIELALAFVIRHPAVTAAIIGPRTMEHLECQLGAADVELSDDVLDRIDEIVPPGTNLNPADARLGEPGAGAGGAAPLNPEPGLEAPPSAVLRAIGPRGAEPSA